MDTYEFVIDLKYYQERKVSDTIVDFPGEYRRSFYHFLQKINVSRKFTKISGGFVVYYRPKTHVRGWCYMSPSGIVEYYNVADESNYVEALSQLFTECCNKAYEKGLVKVKIRCKSLNYLDHSAIEMLLEKIECSVKLNIFNKK